MSSDQNWRTEVNAEDYFGHQKKKLQTADRRPVIRKASDLVGPGIDKNAVRITDYNNLLATFDGFYSSDVGAASAPNDTDQFTGVTVSDAFLGGSQTFTSLQTGYTYRRTFTRNLLDSSALYWTDWATLSDLDSRVAALEGLNLSTRVTALESEVNPLYTGTLNFFGTNLTEGFLITGNVTFPGGAFSAPPAAWGIICGAAATGSAASVVCKTVDTVTTSGCRLVLVNNGSALATFTDLPVRWFAQKNV